ncbi:MAG TPA: polysaccharide biosynthesis protein [Firmicutes bacterium]|nr:polysaccharide biosynthesis protein [Bacillota bacterium]
MGNNRFLKGAFILSFGMILSKILGLVYVFQFVNLVGEAGNSLYSYAYNYYTLFLSLSTMGIPLGIAKFVSRYNAQGEYDTSRKMFKNGAVVLIGLGVVAFTLMYITAPSQAARVLGSKDTVNTVEHVTVAIRLVSFALLIVPIMALFRGFSQGHHDMLPTSVSQVVEQLVRVACIIGGSYFIIFGLDLDPRYAVYFSVFAAFIAALAGLGVLYYYWRKNVPHYDELLAQTIPHEPRNIGELWKELIIFAVPFAILGLSTSLYNFIDATSLNSALTSSGLNSKLADLLFGVYNTNLFKVIAIPITIAIAFGQPLIPELTTLHMQGDKKGVRKNISLALQMIAFIIIPAVIGLSVLAQPVYVALFNSRTIGINAWGIEIFRIGSYIGLFLGTYSIIASILQGINQQYKGIIYLAIGVFIKAIINVPLVHLFQIDGSIYATMIGMSVTLVLCMHTIMKETNFKLNLLLRRLFAITLFASIMGGIVFGVNGLLEIWLPVGVEPASRINAMIHLVVAGGLGMIVYFALAMYFDLTTLIFGNKFSLNSIKNRIKRRK